MELVEKLCLKSELESINIIECHIESLKNQFNINDKRYGKMMLAVVEAVTNAIVHGNEEDQSKYVNFETYISDKKLSFKVIDQGTGFDTEKVPNPTLPQNLEKLNGRGVFLIHQLADEVGFFDNGTRIELGFYL
jgi:serine/threonine-protein kinase RsbW